MRQKFDSAAACIAWLLRESLPQACALCAGAVASGDLAMLCAACTRDLPWLERACPRCALPTAHDAPCRRCLARAPPWRAAHAAFLYAFPLDRLLHALKYRGALAYAPLLAQALARGVADKIADGRLARPDALVALPLANARQRERGYNQAQEIARPLARMLGVPLVAALSRARDTPALATMPWRDRQRAMAGAFTATRSLRGRRVALVDDVLTTGATLRAATLALRAAGAWEVQVFVVARTPGPAPDAPTPAAPRAAAYTATP